MKKILLTTLIFLSLSCSSAAPNPDASPDWYVSPKENNFEKLYGVAEGYTLEESTKYALADAASRLMVNISSSSNLIREENSNSTNEEMRQQVRQNVEKINFTNFRVSKSAKIGPKFYAEVTVERKPFLDEQQQQLSFLERQVADLEKNLAGKNAIQKRNNLIKILDFEKEIELKSYILKGAGVDLDVGKKLEKVADFRNQLNALSDNIEFYFTPYSDAKVAKILRNYLNKEKLKIVEGPDKSGHDQIAIQARVKAKNNKIYSSFMVRLEVDIANMAGGKTIASNSIEVSGSSAINMEEAADAALVAFGEEVEKQGVLKVIGILK